MKKLFFILIAVAVVILSSCSKDADEMSPVSQQTKSSLKKSKLNLVPIKGSCVGTAALVSWTPPSPVVNKIITAQGQFSHCGNSTITLIFSYVTLNLTQSATFNGIMLNGATATIMAANGDKIYCNLNPMSTYGTFGYCGTYKFGGWVPSGLIPSPPYPAFLPTTNEIFPMTATIAGGTGRFVNATGTFQCWGSQWDIPTIFPPTQASTAFPIPSKLECEGLINY
ncbi:MAG: hypothetical protein NTZ33_01965 [Bacteroidetes bacterium]|nr:hypothetical protein [Bacteroidota bacterium]